MTMIANILDELHTISIQILKSCSTVLSEQKCVRFKGSFIGIGRFLNLPILYIMCIRIAMQCKI